ncbi:MAG: 16S rRNA (guanine(527)-N(7))-methyltransferase RsmG [Acidimicrobiales bacterium]
MGPGPTEPHVRHALGYALATGPLGQRRCLDLGSGAGLPGLPLAVAWPQSNWILLDARQKRCAFLRQVVDDLGLGSRTQVVASRAEDFGRGDQRGSLDVVVSRSFGGPAVVAECAAPLLRPSGCLVVSEPPGRDDSSDGDEEKRWPPEGVTQLGMAVDGRFHGPVGTFQRLRQTFICPKTYPRRAGIPEKRPLF